MLPLMDELCCRCAKFIANALDSDSDVVSYVARHGVYVVAEMHISAARDIVFMFGVFSLLMLFLLCAVYLSCFMSDTDTLLSAFLRVISLCMLFLLCQLVTCALFYVPCVRFSLLHNGSNDVDCRRWTNRNAV